MKYYGALTALATLGFTGLIHALPTAIDIAARDLTTEDILRLAEGYPPHNSHIKKRAVCNADNVLRLLRDKRYSSSASAFCSGFIQPTITDTTHVPTTLTTEKTETPPPAFITVTDISTSTDVETSTSTLYIPTTAIGAPSLAKRDEIAYPPWLSTQYPPSRVSSACSCYITAPNPATHVTKTVVTGTVTTFSKTITLPPAVSTVTESVTTVVTITSIVTTTPEIITCGATPACRRIDRPTFGPFQSGLTHEQCLTSCLETDGCLSVQYGVSGSVQGVCFLSTWDVADTYAADTSPGNAICAWWVMDDVECAYLD
ncbi:hypothetical protein TWF281_011361 [Arthrobotrys megalospora]